MFAKDTVHISLDLETTGITPGCGILSIGAVSLDFKHRFYEKIKPYSHRSYGLWEESETIAWWEEQETKVREEAFSGTKWIDKVLTEFNIFIGEIGISDEKLFVWCNGADFDMPIMNCAYRRTKISSPFSPWNVRCLRTMRNLYPEVKKPPFIGDKHNALTDARNQAEHLILLLEEHKRKISL